MVDVQAPYRWNLRRLELGRVLDVGCGLGRNLAQLGPDSVGVDHNAESIRIAKERGLTAYTVEEFTASTDARHGEYDSLLFAHVLEHMDRDAALGLVRGYLPYLKPGGRVCMITPQEKGYRSDATHVEYVDMDGLRSLASDAELTVERGYSFPLPRPFGRVFTYNEFVLVASR
jgi:2-polyprenyl-3-methyl-5-hydroxy-6-metoxy-1,4-benzoquinol methylase